jgi:hypothetical protein
MKARPCKLVKGEGYVECNTDQATHVAIMFPGPSGIKVLPFILKGTREGTGCWTWNGDTEKPTLHPSVKTQGYDEATDSDYVCHTFVNDGVAQFLSDTTHALKDTSVAMMDVLPLS